MYCLECATGASCILLALLVGYYKLLINQSAKQTITASVCRENAS